MVDRLLDPTLLVPIIGISAMVLRAILPKRPAAIPWRELVVVCFVAPLWERRLRKAGASQKDIRRMLRRLEPPGGPG